MSHNLFLRDKKTLKDRLYVLYHFANLQTVMLTLLNLQREINDRSSHKFIERMRKSGAGTLSRKNSAQSIDPNADMRRFYSLFTIKIILSKTMFSLVQ